MLIQDGEREIVSNRVEYQTSCLRYSSKDLYH